MLIYPTCPTANTREYKRRRPVSRTINEPPLELLHTARFGLPESDTGGYGLRSLPVFNAFFPRGRARVWREHRTRQTFDFGNIGLWVPTITTASLVANFKLGSSPTRTDFPGAFTTTPCLVVPPAVYTSTCAALSLQSINSHSTSSLARRPPEVDGNRWHVRALWGRITNCSLTHTHGVWAKQFVGGFAGTGHRHGIPSHTAPQPRILGRSYSPPLPALVGWWD